MRTVTFAPGEGCQHRDAQRQKLRLPCRPILHVLQVDEHIAAGGAQCIRQCLWVSVVHPEGHGRLATCLAACNQCVDQPELVVDQRTAMNSEGHTRRARCPAVGTPGQIILHSLEGVRCCRVVVAGFGQLGWRRDRVGRLAVMPGAQISEEGPEILLAAIGVIGDQPPGHRLRQVAERGRTATYANPGCARVGQCLA